VRLPAAEVDALIRSTANGLHEVMIDLEQQVITDDQGFQARFSTDPYGRELLLRGLDEIGRTLLEEPAIAAYERRLG
jgi:3-isopropylmalate/(R)-2-methylmalate dehydratase small subunit